MLSSGFIISYIPHNSYIINLVNTRRNLSEMGRRQAVYYGQILRNLQIPICYPIQTSPFCRAIQTAQLAFGNIGIQIDPFWFEIYKLSGNLPSAE
jgi:broad specificity phosphatase PhoE